VFRIAQQEGKIDGDIGPSDIPGGCSSLARRRDRVHRQGRALASAGRALQRCRGDGDRTGHQTGMVQGRTGKGVIEQWH
jgi:hypothetical protein